MRACLLWLSLAACVPVAGDELDDSDAVSRYVPPPAHAAAPAS